MKRKYAVTGIGNAIIDILALVEDKFLEENSLEKNAMILIGENESEKLSQLKYEKICSGGSVSNSIATIAGLGLSAALIGKVGADDHGNIFTKELEKISVDFHCKNKSEAGSTARSFVLVSPDGHRTMCTFLGKASEIASEIDEKIIADSEILYLEGYLWDKEETIFALKNAINLAKKNQTKIAFTLSDSFCVTRHHQEFLNLLPDLDILFSNEFEIKALLQIDEIDFDAISKIAKENNLILVVTRSENGALIFASGKYYEIPTHKIALAVDTTGAGDCFAAGFLYGLVNNYSLEKSAEIGNLLAGKIITRLGARLSDDEIKQLNLK
jgi:sugar/nucleoside kinase (ribokinase family)